MKTNELRIGNYVMYADVICKVEGYSRGFLETDGVNSLISAFQSIPLSEEWLLKLGFHKGKDDYFQSENVFSINDLFIYQHTENIFSLYHYNDVKVYIKSVHKLQNLFFAIYGSELLLKN